MVVFNSVSLEKHFLAQGCICSVIYCVVLQYVLLASLLVNYKVLQTGSVGVHRDNSIENVGFFLYRRVYLPIISILSILCESRECHPAPHLPK